MKVYAHTIGDADVFSARDPNNAERLTDLALDDSSTAKSRTVITSKTEDDKSGVRRTMIRVAIPIPPAIAANCCCGTKKTSATGQRISVHFVAEMPASLMDTPIGADDSAFGQASLEQVMRYLHTLLFGFPLETGSAVNGIEPWDYLESPDSPVVRGLRGALPVDVAAGVYGETTTNAS